QAMTTLRQFSEKERNYHEYQARQNYLRQQRTIQWELAQERQEKQQALREKAAAMQKAEAALQEKDAAMQKANDALAEIERLKALLAAK
ncbi:MAG TPA: hypothetical protein VJ001_01185, partial [Rhodocyclaceae bacterium]|nr:hypothetical protein [Rhodocyclaceae bacterium]